MLDRNSMRDLAQLPRLHQNTPDIGVLSAGAGVWAVVFPGAGYDPESVLALFLNMHIGYDITAIHLRECGEMRIWSIVTRSKIKR